MRSKSRKKKSAYWRGEKIVLFFKRGILALFIFIFISLAVLGVKTLARAFPVKNVQVSGNYHLEKQLIKEAVKNGSGNSLFKLSLEELETRLKKIAWIKKVSLRKQFPDTVMIHVEEAVPRALLKVDKHMFLVEAGGSVLEEIEEKSIPFLPVIIGINPKKDRGGILESLKLIDALAEKDVLSQQESIEIMLKPYGLVMNIDGEYVKIGFGNYSEKIGRWRELEAEVRKKNIEIDYVDLRFENEVVVKPLKKIKKAELKKKVKQGSRR